MVASYIEIIERVNVISFSDEHMKRMTDNLRFYATAHPACRCNKIIVHAKKLLLILHHDLQDR